LATRCETAPSVEAEPVLRGLGQERFEVAHLALHDRVHVTVDEFVRVRAPAVFV